MFNEIDQILRKMKRRIDLILILSLINLILTLILAGIIFATQTPKTEIQDTDYIAVYECKNDKLKLIWHAQELTQEQIKELKKLEGQPCKAQK